jgi:hypothetical protein
MNPYAVSEGTNISPKTLLVVIIAARTAGQS